MILMELRYLRTLVPEYGALGFKTGKYRMRGRGVVLQYRKDGEWKDIEEVIEVDEKHILS
jgi:hypothetical protein